MARRQPEQQAPPVQRVRVQYAKRGRLRFTSHRDVSRAVERAVSRARLPIAFSSGFHPHPRISYAGASPTGAASEAEYLELAMAEVTDPADVGRRLDAALPEGIDVVSAVESPGGSLADRLEASRWLVDLTGVGLAEVAAAVDRFLAEESVEVERMTKKGVRRFDCRAAVVSLTVGEEPDRVRLDLLLRHGTPAVRATDVLTGLVEGAGLPPVADPLLTRLAQGTLPADAVEVGDPFA
ncbi:TIGR03936 family radical SAM-associated protein [Nocardioides panacisoli]|nr:TIGR03936 family radical SAM-associated protein [Nocardioides panacisoli]QYJ04435.1 TIGR03936 family radical SAM-associated protein [Nocardioides panacisoli]